jgi:hypothetical protein
MKTYNQNEKNNICKFVSINEIINYEPPKYTPNWDGTFNRIKRGKSAYFRPNREFSTFNININNTNSLGLNKKSEGIYVILSNKFKFFYVGKTLANIKQRLHSHIQKFTSINNNMYTTPLKWQKLAFHRYNVLKENSVKLDDLNIKFYHFSNNASCGIEELENKIYLKYIVLLPEFLSLNDPKRLKNKINSNKFLKQLNKNN